MELEVNERYMILEQLAEELIKDHPRQDIVKKGMESSGLEYTEDLVTCINSVLSALHVGGLQRKKVEHGKRSS